VWAEKEGWERGGIDQSKGRKGKNSGEVLSIKRKRRDGRGKSKSEQRVSLKNWETSNERLAKRNEKRKGLIGRP